MGKLRRQFTSSFHPGLTMIVAKFSVGVGGAPTLDSTAHGIKSVTRTSTGKFVVNLDEKYLGLTSIQMTLGGATADGYMARLDSEFLTGEPGVNSGDGYAIIDIIDGYQTGALADPIDHDVYINLLVKTSEQG